MHALLLFHHSFVVKIVTQFLLNCVPKSFSVQYVHINASFEIDIMRSPSSTFKGLTPIQWKDLRLSYRAQLAHCKEGQTHDLYCSCNMHIACNCGRWSKCFKGRQEFPDSWLPESGPIHCNLLQSIAILQPAGHKMASAPNFPHFHGVCSANLLWQPCWTSIVAVLLKSAEALTPFLNFAVGCHAVGFPKNF